MVTIGGAILSLYLSDKSNREDMNEAVVDEEAVEAEDDRKP